jgi:heme/copper-type cytochrome/quinol oxidase subunit 2
MNVLSEIHALPIVIGIVACCAGILMLSVVRFRRAQGTLLAQWGRSGKVPMSLTGFITTWLYVIEWGVIVLLDGLGKISQTEPHVRNAALVSTVLVMAISLVDWYRNSRES